MRSESRDCRPLLAGVAAIVLWCFTGACFAAGSRLLGPMVFTTAICLVGVVTGAALHGVQGRPLSGLVRMPMRVWIAGFFGISVYTVVLVLAVGIAPDADVAQVALTNYLWPIFVVLFGATLRPRGAAPIGGGQLAMLVGAALLGFAGVVLTRGIETFTRHPAGLVPHGLALTGAILWALYCVLLRRWEIPDEQNGSTAQWVLCAVVAATVGAARGEWSALGLPPPAAIGWVLFCGIGPVGLAYYWWEIGMKRGPAHLIAVLSFFIPVGSALLLGLFFRSALSPMLLPGAALIAGASWLARKAA